MEGNDKEGRVWKTTSYQEQHFCSVSGFADYSKSDTWRVFLKKKSYLALLLVAHVSSQNMSHPLYSNCIVNSSLKMKSVLVKKIK